MKVIHTTETLEAQTSRGLKKFWRGLAHLDDDGRAYTNSESWQETATGLSVTKVSTLKEIKGKNIGRSNETTPEQQAHLEVVASAKRKIDSGYAGKDTPTERLTLPMLAHSYWKRNHDIDWDKDVFVQPKLDGTRMIFDGRRGWSRQGKLYLPEVIAHLQCNLPEGILLDGELMLPGDHSFQDSIRAIKKFRPGVTPKLVFHVYDIATQGAPFSVRTVSVAKLFWNDKWDLWGKDGFDLVETRRIKSESEIHDLHETYVKKGFEGIMIRHGDADYKIGNRSSSLLKLKHFIDDEFEITGVGEGSGKEKGCAIFTCKTADEKSFNVRPQGTIAQRQEYFNQGEDLIGEMLTVRYQELTEDGIPRFPVGVEIRNYEGVTIIHKS